MNYLINELKKSLDGCRVTTPADTKRMFASLDEAFVAHDQIARDAWLRFQDVMGDIGDSYIRDPGERAEMIRDITEAAREVLGPLSLLNFNGLGES